MNVQAVDYEPFDPRFREDVFDHYREVRETAPVFQSKMGYWVVSRFNDIRNVQRAPNIFSSLPVTQEMMGMGKDLDSSYPIAELNAQMPVDIEEFMAAPILVGTDDPKHAELRNIVNRAFLPKRVAQWDETIFSYTRECLAGIDRSSTWDVVSKLAIPLPIWTFSGILGAGVENREHMKRWSEIAIDAALGNVRHSREATMGMLTMMRDFSQLFGPMIEKRRYEPGEDVISDIVRAEEKDTLTAPETLMFILLLMVAGTETTSNLIGNTIVALMQNPDQLDILAQDRSLIPNAIEESLRWRSPAQLTIRAPKVDSIVGGQMIPAGGLMTLLNGSGNRDPEIFPEPDKFDVTRENAKLHLSFGHGIHLCLGAHLAKREAAIVLGELMDDLPHWRLVNETPERLENNAVFGYKEIILTPR